MRTLPPQRTPRPGSGPPHSLTGWAGRRRSSWRRCFASPRCGMGRAGRGRDRGCQTGLAGALQAVSDDRDAGGGPRAARLRVGPGGHPRTRRPGHLGEAAPGRRTGLARLPLTAPAAAAGPGRARVRLRRRRTFTRPNRAIPEVPAPIILNLPLPCVLGNHSRGRSPRHRSPPSSRRLQLSNRSEIIAAPSVDHTYELDSSERQITMLP